MKISYISFIFKLNEKKKESLKNELEKRITRKYLLEGALVFNRELKTFQTGRLDKKGVEKNGGGVDPQRNCALK